MGNVAVHEVIGLDEDGTTPIFRTYDHHAVTDMTLPDTWSEDEKFRQITHVDGFWPAMSAAKPAWVESDDDAFASALSIFYGCPVGRPSDWDGQVN